MSIMTILEQGQVQKSFDDAALAAGDGTVFALPAQAVLVTWQTSFVTPPSAVDISIQTSLDNISWDDSANTTSTTGAIGSFVTSAVFIRAIVNSATDGDTFTVQLISKNASLNSQQALTGSIEEGEVAFGIAGNAIAGSANLTWDDVNSILQLVQLVKLSSIADDSGDSDASLLLQPGGVVTDEVGLILASAFTDPSTWTGLRLGMVGNAAQISSLINGSNGATALQLFGGNQGVRITAIAGNVEFQTSGGGVISPLQNVVVAAGKTITSEYNSSDGSPGIDTTITTASLVGKTITVKDGLITGFA